MIKKKTVVGKLGLPLADLLKSLEGCTVDSVKIRREDEVLHVTIAAREQYGRPQKVLAFSIVDADDFERMLNGFNEKMAGILSKLREIVTQLGVKE